MNELFDNFEISVLFGDQTVLERENVETKPVLNRAIGQGRLAVPLRLSLVAIHPVVDGVPLNVRQGCHQFAEKRA